MNRFSYFHIVIVIGVLLVPACVEAQTVTANATVSETVALSVLPNFNRNNIDVDVVSSGRTVRMTLAGNPGKSPVIRVPLIVRSNSSFRISAAVESTTAELTHLSVIDVRATGSLVSPEAISEFEIAPQFDLTSDPLLVLSGPRVSLGGTLTSPNNALQITLLIRLKPQPGRDWLVHITFSAYY
jgi:hypothetical protein